MKRTICFSLFFIFYQTAFSQLPAIDSMKRSLEHTTDPEERFKTLNEILVNIDALGIPIPDSTYWLEMLQIGQKTKNDLILATSYNWIGYNFYRVKGAYTSALEYYFKALPLAERSGNKRRISSLCFDIGQVYTLLDNSEEAFKYTRKGGENLPDRSSPMYNYMLVQFQRGMSNSFLKLNRLDSALYYAQQMEQTSMLLNAKIFRFNAKSQAATVYAQMGETELADIYFRKAKSDAAFISEGSRKLFFFKSYIPFLIKNKRIREAVLETDTFYAQARETKNLLSLLKSSGYKRELFEIQKMTDSAYYYSRMEADLNDKIFNQDNKNAIQAMVLKQRLREIEETEKQNSARETDRQNLQYIIIAIGILSLLTLFLMLSHSFITNSKTIEFIGIVTLIIVFEFLNLLLHPFLEGITGHSPILILLALVCIAALLIPLHHKVEKWAIHKLVEKNKRIRLAVAKKTIEQLEGDQATFN